MATTISTTTETTTTETTYSCGIFAITLLLYVGFRLFLIYKMLLAEHNNYKKEWTKSDIKSQSYGENATTVDRTRYHNNNYMSQRNFERSDWSREMKWSLSLCVHLDGRIIYSLTLMRKTLMFFCCYIALFDISVFCIILEELFFEKLFQRIIIWETFPTNYSTLQH